jgi:hypothetical protein
VRRRLAPGRLPLIKWEPLALIGVHSPPALAPVSVPGLFFAAAASAADSEVVSTT